MSRTPSQITSSRQVSRHAGPQKYVKARRTRVTRRTAVGVAVGLFAVIGGGAAWAASYVANINARLNNTERIDDDLRESLAVTEDVEPDDPFYMLLMGIDKDEGRTEDANYGESDSNYRADSIMLVRIDPPTPSVTLVSIHRDTWLELGEYGMNKINAAFTFGGPAYMVETVEDLAGVDITHYAEVDMDGFAAIVDQLGGITVNLPVDVYDPNYTGLDLKAGEVELDGVTAALLCRARHAYDSYGDGDVYRAANQRSVIKAIVKKILASDVVTMTSTVETLATYVNTDMDVASIVNLALQMRNLDIDNNVWSAMCPTAGYYDESLGVWYENLQVDAWNKMMDRVRQGLPPLDEDDYDQTDGVAAESAE